MQKNIDRAKKQLFSNLRRNIRSESVSRAMELVPREKFVPRESRHMAYLDMPLSIGEGQTISQPFIVALMIAALSLRGDEKVLEVGTGSGYQAAILSVLVPRGRVTSVELVPILAQRARNLLRELDYRNVSVEQAGAILGSPEQSPFDAIIVAAASPKLQESLVSQLAVGGRLIIPVGTLEQQELVLALRTDEGVSVQMLGPCRFVPLISREAFPKIL